MDFSHDEIEKRNLIEEYLLGRLSEEEETALEEHLLQCESCRDKCLQTEQVINALKSSQAADKTFQTPSAAKRHIGWLAISLRIAAVFVLVAGIAILYNKTKDHPGEIALQTNPVMVDTLNKTGDDTIKQNAPKESRYETSSQARTAEAKNENRDITARVKDEWIAAAYRPSPVFEQAIGNAVRGKALKVIAPADSAVFSNNTTVVFNWENPEDKKMALLVRKNTGKSVFKQVVLPPYALDVEDPGLYYWQLLEGDQVVHTGKFLVNQ
ncbi:MAG: zf-HC2 domain-containing protein [Bacteroidales bacterium]